MKSYASWIVRDPSLIRDVVGLALDTLLLELDAAVEVLDLNVDADRLQLLLVMTAVRSVHD